MVNFFNSSFNSTTYSWDFGDGGNSTASNPTHTYTNPGNYTVTLYAYGTGNCTNSDTLVLTNYINVGNTAGPVTAACIPPTTAYCCGYGITNVTFNTINHTSGNGIDNYQDYSCADSTYLSAGDPYYLNVTTNATSPERVKAWIDYNNDGAFNNTNEFVYDQTATGLHSAIVYTPINATLNTPLRMRIISDESINSIPNSCTSPVKGQAEDYMVTFYPNTLPPLADFTANYTTIQAGGSVDFYDLTLHAPTGWNWTFAGGSPSTSSLQNPTAITYNNTGVYMVQLVATNSFGTDTAVQVTYINVINVANACSTSSTTAPSGYFYDSGGPGGNYQDNENCGFLITPACVSSVTITFDSLWIENYFDSIYIFDGPNAQAPLIYEQTGFYTNLPPITASSGKMYILFRSDYLFSFAGFSATWTSAPITAPPAANFTQTPSAPVALVPVQFTDLSTNNPNAWSWNFGDLGTSTLQNPVHTYMAAGTYTVTLVATNCISSDTIFMVITVTPNGIEELAAGSTVSVFPNPFTEQTTLLILSPGGFKNAEVELLDVLGQQVMQMDIAVSGKRTEVPIQRTGMASGVYFYKVYAVNREGKAVIGAGKLVVE
jgi:PKD repeat protein